MERDAFERRERILVRVGGSNSEAVKMAKGPFLCVVEESKERSRFDKEGDRSRAGRSPGRSTVNLRSFLFEVRPEGAFNADNLPRSSLHSVAEKSPGRRKSKRGELVMRSL